MPRAYKLERIAIPEASRTVKDWFPTRESAEAAVTAIRTHINLTGETHTAPAHTHTKPPPDAVPVYIAAIDLPDRYVKAGRLAPCPCCWRESPKFGRCKVAWFPDERVIRVIGPDCFAALNPEAHEKAQSTFEIEQEQKRNTKFLLSNLPHLDKVISTLRRAINVAHALETFHAELHSKLPAVQLKLWQHVKRNGELSVTVEEQEFRRGADGQMYSHAVAVPKLYARLDGYEMLDAALEPLSSSLKKALEKIEPYSIGQDAQAAVDAMSDEKRREVAETLSRCVSKAEEKIARIEILRSFTQRVAINTLRNWAAQDECPITLHCSHDGQTIAFGKREHNTINVQIPDNINLNIGEITFWVGREKRVR